MIKFTVVVSLIQFAAYLASRGIESLALRRNIRFGSLLAIVIGSYFYWNNGDALIQKPYASDIAYHMIVPVFSSHNASLVCALLWSLFCTEDTTLQKLALLIADRFFSIAVS